MRKIPEQPFEVSHTREEGRDMMPEQTDYTAEQEEPMTREVLDSPEMKAKIEKARARARAGRTGPGKTADDLVSLAREQRRVGSRT